MKVSTKIGAVLGSFGICWFVSRLLTDAVVPVTNTQLAVANVNGGNVEWQALNMFSSHNGLLSAGIFVMWALFSLIVFKKEIIKMIKSMKNSLMLFVLCTMVLGSFGCIKPYDKPEYVEIGSSETAFVIPLEGDTKSQAKFDSAAFLETKKVSAKRIQIAHRWNQTGRWETDGQYISTVKVIRVDRSPVTRVWQTDGNKGKDQAIWIESADSVGFSMGWSCTAYIKEEDASNFLYMYPSGSLAAVMDQEIRARIQQVSSRVAAMYKLDDLRGKKNELADSVKEDITKFFISRGITITTIGMVGGMTYENPKIQDAIDLTVVSQQEKVNAKAMLDAQEDKNTRIKSEALALAEAARMKAKGEADGQLMKAQAEASGVQAVSKAIADANSNPQLVSLKQIEVDKIRAEKWNGQYPDTIVGAGSNTWVGLGSSSSTTQQILSK
jgi:hypothetical protein